MIIRLSQYNIVHRELELRSHHLGWSISSRIEYSNGWPAIRNVADLRNIRIRAMLKEAERE